jgi:hypothetical protein
MTGTDRVPSSPPMYRCHSRKSPIWDGAPNKIDPFGGHTRVTSASSPLGQRQTPHLQHPTKVANLFRKGLNGRKYDMDSCLRGISLGCRLWVDHASSTKGKSQNIGPVARQEKLTHTHTHTHTQLHIQTYTHTHQTGRKCHGHLDV